MTDTILLKELCLFTSEAVQDIILPVRINKGDSQQIFRAANVYSMRLSDSSTAKHMVPYIIHQVITGNDSQPQGHAASSSATVRSIFCVYNENEEEGGLMLLNLMERVRVNLLEQLKIGDQFQLDLKSALETLIYPEHLSPYYAGEMISHWKIPAVQREYKLFL